MTPTHESGSVIIKFTNGLLHNLNLKDYFGSPRVTVRCYKKLQLASFKIRSDTLTVSRCVTCHFNIAVIFRGRKNRGKNQIPRRPTVPGDEKHHRRRNAEIGYSDSSRTEVRDTGRGYAPSRADNAAIAISSAYDRAFLECLPFSG